MTDRSLPDRVADLERRVEALEGPRTHRPAPAEAGAGGVHYSGDVHLHGDVTWSITLDGRAALDLDDDPRVAVLAAAPAAPRTCRRRPASRPPGSCTTTSGR